jgi:hypothetical protein
MVGETVYVYVGSESGVGEYYFQGQVERYQPSKILEGTRDVLLDQSWQNWGTEPTMEFQEGAVWIVNYGPVLPERCFLRLPAGGILTPIERWIRVKSFVQVETNLIKGIKITRRTHVRGPILDLETVHEWVADGYYNCTKEDWSFEDAYRRIAKSLAMQRP